MNQRQQEILDRLNRIGKILIEEEAKHFGVAPHDNTPGFTFSGEKRTGGAD